MTIKKLNGLQVDSLKTLLLDAYYQPAQFAQLLNRMDRKLAAISASGNYDTDIYEVVQAANAQGWVYPLIFMVMQDTLHKANQPLHAALQRLLQEIMVAPPAQAPPPAPDEWFDFNRLLEIYALAVKRGLAGKRDALFSSLPNSYLPPTPGKDTLSQLFEDLHKLNQDMAVIGAPGVIPFERWLRSAAALVMFSADSKFFLACADEIAHQDEQNHV